MEINLIVAVDEKNGIGKNGKLPWHIPEDLRRFKALTINNVVIMGRNTFKSLSNNPLKDRRNIVVSSSKFASFKSVIDTIKAINIHNQLKFNINNTQSVWLIGGAGIYKEALENNLVDKLYITRVKGNYDCDVFMPEIDYSKWQLIESDDIGVCVFEVYEKINN